jgi:dienelactone hydrolase
LDTHQIRYIQGTASLTGVFVPSQRTPTPDDGVLVIHGGAGVDTHALNRAQRFADLGYHAFACDMYGEGVPGDRGRVMATIMALRRDRLALQQRAEAGIEVLRQHLPPDGRIAIVGYCFGGMVALELARAGLAVAAIVCVHGSLTTTVRAGAGTVRSPVLVCHGALDPHSPPADVAAFIEEMNSAAADWQLVAYGGAMHGFTHEDARGQTPGVRHDARADARSAAAIQTFLDEAFARPDAGLGTTPPSQETLS